MTQKTEGYQPKSNSDSSAVRAVPDPGWTPAGGSAAMRPWPHTHPSFFATEQDMRYLCLKMSIECSVSGEDLKVALTRADCFYKFIKNGATL